jgi:transcriptional regulator with XRE-family HTH domain
MTISKSIGSTIKLCRGQRGLSQLELAESAGLSVSYLSLIEQGKRTLNLEVLETITNALRIPLNILVFLASDKTELAELDKSAAEKLSLIALKLMKDDDEQAVLQK